MTLIKQEGRQKEDIKKGEFSNQRNSISKTQQSNTHCYTHHNTQPGQISKLLSTQFFFPQSRASETIEFSKKHTKSASPEP